MPAMPSVRAFRTSRMVLVLLSHLYVYLHYLLISTSGNPSAILYTFK